jgi:serine/threonine protein kinase
LLIIINRGEFGSVYLGFCRGTLERVAVKVTGNNAPHGHIPRDFDDEADMAKYVGHIPGVIKYIDTCITTQYCYLIMQFASGGDLHNYIILHMPLPEMEVKNIFKQMLVAIKVSTLN